MISAEHISLSKGNKTLLQDMSIRIEPGKFTALCGPNGAGKTTLLRVMAGDMRHDMGKVLYNDQDIRTYAPAALAQHRAVMTQHSTLSFPFTVLETLEFALSALPTPQRDPGLCIEVIKHLTLEDFLKQKVNTLSGGEAQRIQLARALVQLWPRLKEEKPCTLFLDEPTASLDLRYQIEMLDCVKTLTQKGLSVFCILHDLNIAALYADQLILLENGHVKASDNPDIILKNTPLLTSVFGCAFETVKHKGRQVLVTLPVDHVVQQAAA